MSQTNGPIWAAQRSRRDTRAWKLAIVDVYEVSTFARLRMVKTPERSREEDPVERDDQTCLRGAWRLFSKAATCFLTRDGVQISDTRWIPGHVGVTGNERADDAAKQATNHSQPTDDLLPLSLIGEIPINPTAAKRTRRAGMATEWQTWIKEEGDARRTERETREIDPDYPSMQFSEDAGPLPRH
ncbi:hypothetical protein B0J17DRAFT_632784 [Rhizoctonia solani]|nr:hypothetical protein B0J17DRAFT_632784 [Rhizoctonia solani]